MKAILEFDLPDDDEYHQLAVKSVDLYFAIYAFEGWLRGLIKYESEGEVYDYDTIESVRKQLYYFLQEHGVSLEMLS